MVAADTYSKRQREFEISEDDVIRNIATYYIVMRKANV